MIKLIICAVFLALTPLAVAQEILQSYYLPEITYDTDIPTPESFLGYQVGEWHVSHDQLQYYMRELANASDRITIEEYARSYENRPLLLLTITSPKNHGRIDEIIAQRAAICDPEKSQRLDLENMPAVIYQGYSIHGNEPSGANASMLVAYYLAAGQSPAIDELLENVVILLDPSFNPDGLQRFSTWVNSHKNAQLTADPNDREYSEAWPRGRTNHYWFDLNRDWLLLQHPESRGRVRNFQKWKPNILTDHHEMGTNSTFFFMPGIPSRTNPLTPQRNQELTGEIATFHAEALDEIGSLYYSEESFDDFYYGKGSTYPDANGCIGILFEQASSRGHMQESENGLLTFPFTIRNQVTTSFSTQKAAVALRQDLLEFQRNFYQNSVKDAKSDPVKAYQFELPGKVADQDYARLHGFINLLLQHDIKVHYAAVRPGSETADGMRYIVPLEQPQYRLVKAIFGTQTEFQDSLFYDVSAWTLPYAYNLRMTELSAQSFKLNMLSHEITQPLVSRYRRNQALVQSDYAYAMPWGEYFAPGALYALQDLGLRLKVAGQPFTLDIGGGLPIQFPRSTLILPVENQSLSSDEIYGALPEIMQHFGVTLWPLPTGKSSNGPDLGSGSIEPLHQPEIMLVVGSGASSYDAGELWHLFDQRYEIPVTKVETGDIGRTDLSRYTTILMGDGSYGGISERGVNALRDWTSDGGVLVLARRAVDWAARNGLVKAERKDVVRTDLEAQRPYDNASADNGSQRIGGAIFKIHLDLTHPLAFGYEDSELPVFRRGTSFYQPTDNAYATPGRYSDDPLLSGYIDAENLEALKGSASIWVGGLGSGRVICFADNPSFRAYWWGTQKLIANAVFFGSTISGSTVARAPAVQTGDE